MKTNHAPEVLPEPTPSPIPHIDEPTITVSTVPSPIVTAAPTQVHTIEVTATYPPTTVAPSTLAPTTAVYTSIETEIPPTSEIATSTIMILTPSETITYEPTQTETITFVETYVPSFSPEPVITPYPSAQKCLSEDDLKKLNDMSQSISNRIPELIEKMSIIVQKFSNKTINNSKENLENNSESLEKIQILISKIKSLSTSSIIRESPVKAFLTAISPVSGTHETLPLKNRVLYVLDKEFTYENVEKTNPDGWIIPTIQGNITYTLPRETIISHIKMLPSNGKANTIKKFALSFSNDNGQIFQTETFNFDKDNKKLQIFWLPSRVKCSAMKVVVFDNYGNSKETCFPGLSLYTVLN